MIKTHPFGRTSHDSSRTILGAAAFGQTTQDETDAAMDLALSYGVNHVDTAASYGDSELRLGDWIHRNGQPFFLATKTGERTKDKAREEIHRSLVRLRVSRVDLLQLHCLVDPAEWDTALGPDGALEAAIEARDQGLVRFIGVTGHGVTVAEMHKRALKRFDFDSVLLPYSYVLAKNEQYLADFNALQDICRSRNVAMQTIKSVVRAPWGEKEHTAATWYEPLEAQEDIDLAVHWVLGHEGLFLNTAGDIHVLPKVLKAAERFESRPPSDKLAGQADRLSMEPLFV